MTVNESENNRESNGLNSPSAYDYLTEDDNKDLRRDELESSYLFDDDETESDETFEEEDFDDSELYSSSSLFDEIEEEESEDEESVYDDYQDSEEPTIFDEIEEEEDEEESEAENAVLRTHDPVFVPLEEVKPEVEEKHVDGPVFVPLESANTIYENLEADEDEPEEAPETVADPDYEMISESEEPEETVVFEDEQEEPEEVSEPEDEPDSEVLDESEEEPEEPEETIVFEEEQEEPEEVSEPVDEPESEVTAESEEELEEPEETVVFEDEQEEPEEVSEPVDEPESEVMAESEEKLEESEETVVFEEEQEEPVVETKQEGKFSLCSHIIEKLPSNSLVRTYLKKQEEGILKDISYTIDQARLAWVIDGKDKMFTIPETDISVIVCSSLNDPMAKIQRQIHAAALMIASRKTTWNILFVTFDGDQKLSDVVSQEISRKTFTDWQWKRAQSLADIITNK